MAIDAAPASVRQGLCFLVIIIVNSKREIAAQRCGHHRGITRVAGDDVGQERHQCISDRSRDQQARGLPMFLLRANDVLITGCE